MIQSDNLRINLHIFLSFLIIMIFFAVRISAFIPITDINSYLFAVCILGMFSFLRRKAERDPTVHYIYQIILSFCLMEILLLTKSDLVDNKYIAMLTKKLKTRTKKILPVSIHNWASLEALKKLLR